jgi:cation-transporting ATPase I
MVLRSLVRLSTAGWELALTVPGHAVRGIRGVVGETAGVVVQATGAGVRAIADVIVAVAGTAAREGNVTRTTVETGQSRVTACPDPVKDRNHTQISEAVLAGGHRLASVGDEVEDSASGAPACDAHTAAGALALDVIGIATAITGRVLRLKRSPTWVTATVTAVVEDPRVRGLLVGWLGTHNAEVVVAGANAVAHGFGQSPTELVLDAALRTVQLGAALGRAAAFDVGKELLCSVDRACLPDDRRFKRPVRTTAAQDYARSAVTASLLAAATTLFFRRGVNEAAKALLAGSPRAARYGPAAFAAGLSGVLARHGVLMRDVERVRLLEQVDTVVLHPNALRGRKRIVLEAHPSATGWDHDQLWDAASAVLTAQDGTPLRPARSKLQLRPVPDHHCSETGLMIASQDGVDVGTIMVGWELDPWAEVVLDTARRAGLKVVMIKDSTLGNFTTLADELADPNEPFLDLVCRLQAEGRVVLTVARIRNSPAAAGGHQVAQERDLLAGLLHSDLAIAVADQGCAVVGCADGTALCGLSGVWRLLWAVPLAQSVARHGKILAQSGAAIAGLLMTTSGQRSTIIAKLGLGLNPVNAATAAALVDGCYAALRVALIPSPQPRPRVAWHALTGEETLTRLATKPSQQPSVLSQASKNVQTLIRAVTDSPVVRPVQVSTQLLSAIRTELTDPLTPILAVGAAASAILGSPVDAILVLAATTINAITGGIQRLRAEQALTVLAKSQKQKARRITDPTTGQTSIIDASELAVGDVIQLRVGDVVPADARLLHVSELEVDESSLTGESFPITKQVAPTPGAAISDRRCIVFEGTTVVAGEGQAVVIATGQHTESGRAAALASRTPPPVGIQVRLQELTRKALPLTLVGGAAVTGLSLIRGHSLREAIKGGVAVAVAAVPEGLPLVATVAQQAAARRLTKRKVLVRTPRTVEALGRVNTVCFDKTGTLTENRLHVVRVSDSNGRVLHPDHPTATTIMRAAARACPRHTGRTLTHAHATDEAILASAPPDKAWTQLDGQPFEASRGYAAAVGTQSDGCTLLVVKGAPEVVLSHCSGLGPTSNTIADALASQGLRVLAIAQRHLGPHEAADASNPLENLKLLGFVALADTPRPSARALIAGLQAAGVNPVMLTGDHPHTARAIAIDLGWPTNTVVLTGHQLVTLDRSQRERLLCNAGVIARVTPEQKLQVIEALQAAKRVVAMVGDGANDAAAIRTADIGVGVTARGSAAARNAADLLLTNDDLTVLVEAITEGRTLWRSVADAISILIGGNAGEVGFTVLGALLTGISPLSVRQLLLINLLTDMFPAMAVAVTAPDTQTTTAPMNPAAAPVGMATLGSPLISQIRHRGVITTLAASTAWIIGNLTPGTTRRTSTMALCGLVGAQLAQTLIGRQRSPLVLTTTLGSAAALTTIIQTPILSHFFGCTPLGPLAWFGVAAAITMALLVPKLLPAVPTAK